MACALKLKVVFALVLTLYILVALVTFDVLLIKFPATFTPSSPSSSSTSSYTSSPTSSSTSSPTLSSTSSELSEKDFESVYG